MLNPGSRLGPYEIVSPLGAGGMGEVYRARDARLGRDVAIKVLPRELAATEELRQRFEREARTISKLSHPGICAIHDVGREGDVEYLVMELIEGETLAARLAKGRMPLDQVLRAAAEIAAALAAAHARGIVHRDLKPANVMLSRSGVKLLDFGLARAFAATDDSLAQTVTQGITLAGESALIGTVPYMAPEQIEGKPVDARTDLFALGAVLHEMITGSRAFPGANQAAVMGAILHQDPPSATTLRSECPPALAALVRKCLIRDADARWSSAHDLALQLREFGEPASRAAAIGAAQPSRRVGAWTPWLVAAAALGVAALLLLRPPPPRAGASGPIRFSLPPPEGGAIANSFEGTSAAISPDGSRIALITADADQRRFSISVRDLAAVGLRAVPGTEGVNSMMWSPDGRSLAFFTGNSLKRVGLDGSAPVPICDVPAGGGKSGTWGIHGDILFSSIQGEAIYQVPASGGTPRVLISTGGKNGVIRVGWPWYLPDGDHFVYCAGGTGPGAGVIQMATRGGESRPLFEARSAVQFTAPDLLVFVREGVLYGQRVDFNAGRLRGGPFAICDSVRYFLSTGSGEFATSAAGTLVYQPSGDVNQPLWFDRQGRTLGTAAAPGGYLDIALSPDGRTLLYSRTWPAIGTYDVWSLDLERGVESRLTTGLGSEFSPLWMPDGRAIAYSAQTEVLPQMFLRDLESGAERKIWPSNGFQIPKGVTPDGRTLVYVERTEHAGFSPRSLQLGASSGPLPLLSAGTHSENVRLSPDGRALAVISDESGQFEAYVMPFPGPGARLRISTGGASTLRWSRDGRELFCLTPNMGLMTVAVTTAPALTVGRPVRLIPAEIAGSWLGFEVTPDGRRILAIVPQVNADLLPLKVVVNWPAGISAR